MERGQPCLSAWQTSASNLQASWTGQDLRGISWPRKALVAGAEPVCGSQGGQCYPQPSGPPREQGVRETCTLQALCPHLPPPPRPVSLEVEQMSTRAAQVPRGQSTSAKWASGLAESGTRALCQPVGTRGLLVTSLLLLPAQPCGHGPPRLGAHGFYCPAPALCAWPAVPGRRAAHLRSPEQVHRKEGHVLFWGWPCLLQAHCQREINGRRYRAPHTEDSPEVVSRL